MVRSMVPNPVGDVDEAAPRTRAFFGLRHPGALCHTDQIPPRRRDSRL